MEFRERFGSAHGACMSAGLAGGLQTAAWMKNAVSRSAVATLMTREEEGEAEAEAEREEKRREKSRRAACWTTAGCEAFQLAYGSPMVRQEGRRNQSIDALVLGYYCHTIQLVCSSIRSFVCSLAFGKL